MRRLGHLQEDEVDGVRNCEALMVSSRGMSGASSAASASSAGDLDENLPPRIAEMLRGAGVDAVSAHELQNVRLADHRQFTHAIREGRAVVTMDTRDFRQRARRAVAGNIEHAGMILIPSSFETNGFAAITAALLDIVRLYPERLGGAVVSAKRPRR